jgi:hypothetical protein
MYLGNQARSTSVIMTGVFIYPMISKKLFASGIIELLQDEAMPNTIL